jgi:hypothetical protein
VKDKKGDRKIKFKNQFADLNSSKASFASPIRPIPSRLIKDQKMHHFKPMFKAKDNIVKQDSNIRNL